MFSEIGKARFEKEMPYIAMHFRIISAHNIVSEFFFFWIPMFLDKIWVFFPHRHGLHKHTSVVGGTLLKSLRFA